MKNKSLLFIPVAVMSLSAIIGCNGNGNKKSDETAIDEAIDAALTLPDGLSSVYSYEAKVYAESAVKNLRSNLVGVNSKAVKKYNDTILYPQEYRNFIGNYEIRVETETKHYDNACATINTKKWDKEVEEGVESNYKTTRSDTIYYQFDESARQYISHDNIEVSYDSFGDAKIPMRTLDNVASEEKKYELGPANDIDQAIYNVNHLMYLDYIKMGNDGQKTDYSYFFRKDDSNVYCVKSDSYTISSPAMISFNGKLTYTINVVMHFAKVNGNWVIDTYAASEDIACDRDIYGNVFSTPQVISSSKYVNTAIYGQITSFTGRDTLGQSEKKEFSSSNAHSYVKEDGRDKETMPYIEDTDNSFGFYDASNLNYILNPGTTNYVLVGSSSKKVKAETKTATATVNASNSNSDVSGFFEDSIYSPIYLLNILGIEDFTYNFESSASAYPVHLSENHVYDLSIGDAKENIKFVDAQPDSYHSITQNGRLTVNESGEYNVKIVLNKDLDTAKVYVGYVRASVGTNDNDYANVTISSLGSGADTINASVINGSITDPIQLSLNTKYNLYKGQNVYISPKTENNVIPMKNISVTMKDDQYGTIDVTQYAIKYNYNITNIYFGEKYFANYIPEVNISVTGSCSSSDIIYIRALNKYKVDNVVIDNGWISSGTEYSSNDITVDKNKTNKFNVLVRDGYVLKVPSVVEVIFGGTVLDQIKPDTEGNIDLSAATLAKVTSGNIVHIAAKLDA